MLVKTQAIVLSKLRYRDNDLIVKCYTRNRGIVSYLLRGVLKSSKGSSKVAYFQPLSQLQIEEDLKPNQTLHFIKEVRLDVVYVSLHTDISKSAIVMFLSEVLASILKEEEANPSLYQYLETTLQWLDHESDFANFHLLFLLELTKHLGCYPDGKAQDFPYFNLSSGKFDLKPQHLYDIVGDDLTTLRGLLNLKFETLHNLKLNSRQRQSFLNVMLLYLELHLGDFRKPKSLQILNQIFN